MATTAQAKRALETFEADLAARKNVVGLGIVPVSETENSNGAMAVAVYVKRKVPLAKLKASDVVPKELLLDGRTRKVAVPTRVIDAGGEISLEAGLGKEPL